MTQRYLHTNTEILTESGWVKISDITEESKIFKYSGALEIKNDVRAIFALDKPYSIQKIVSDKSQFVCNDSFSQRFFTEESVENDKCYLLTDIADQVEKVSKNGTICHIDSKTFLPVSVDFEKVFIPANVEKTGPVTISELQHENNDFYSILIPGGSIVIKYNGFPTIFNCLIS